MARPAQPEPPSPQGGGGSAASGPAPRPGRPPTLRALQLDVHRARAEVASARRGPYDRNAIIRAQQDLLAALEAYVDRLAGSAASVHLSLRCEVDLLRRVTSHPRD